MMYCYKCGKQYPVNYNRCSDCFEPLKCVPPTREFIAKGKPMKNVTFLGVEGSGKTVLTTTLVNVFKAHESEGWYLRPDSRESFRFLEQAPKSLEGDALPHQTTALKRLAWSAQLDGQTVRTFDVLDYPGEIYRLAFLEAKDDPDPATFAERVASNKDDIDAVLAHLLESDQVFVLFNLADAENISKNAANLDAVWVTNACLDYLHRLPNKPTITLLLTQIDRYVDINQYELDPEVYVAHHLPLIHRNFPNLDVLAVSAIGPADAAFGIDSIILRCLFECDTVQAIVNEVRNGSKQAYSWLDNARLSTLSSTSLSYTADQIARCRDAAARLPWFIPLRQLRDNGFIVDSNEITDELTILPLLNTVDMSLCPEKRLDGLKSARDNLEAFEGASLNGCKYKNKFLSDIKIAVNECEKQIARNIVVRKRCDITIVIIAVVALVELAVIFGRMMF